MEKLLPFTYDSNVREREADELPASFSQPQAGLAQALLEGAWMECRHPLGHTPTRVNRSSLLSGFLGALFLTASPAAAQVAPERPNDDEASAPSSADHDEHESRSQQGEGQSGESESAKGEEESAALDEWEVVVESPPRRHGPYFRLNGEVARAELPHRYEGSLEGDGFNTSFTGHGRDKDLALGGRLEVGYAIVMSPRLTLAPRAGAALSQMSTHSVHEVDNQAFQWWGHRRWWSATVGIELQLFKRLVGVSLDLGATGTTQKITEVEPRDLQLDVTGTGGALGRLGVNMRLLRGSSWGGGLLAFAEAMIGPSGFSWGIETGHRAGGALFIEWDGSRR